MTSSRQYDWEAIELAYYSYMPMQRLFRKFNITRRSFYYHTERMGWPLQDGSFTASRLKYRQKHLLQQAYIMLGRKMEKTAKRINIAENMTSIDANREAHTLRSLVSLLDQLRTMETDIREEETQTTGDNNDKAEHLRSSLAERLTRLETEPD